MRRWSGSGSSSADTSAPRTPWLDQVHQLLEIFPHEPENSHEELHQSPDPGKGKGKGKQEATDEELAHSLFVEEALKGFSEYSGEVAWSGGTLPRDHERMLGDYRAAQQNQQAMDDLDLALRLLQGELSAAEQDGTAKALSPPVDTEIFNLYRLLADSDLPVEFSAELPAINTKCVVCGETISGKSATLLCGHRYDISCLKDMFSANVNDEYRFPPRCCGQAVPMNHVEEDLPLETAELYRTKAAEYQTPVRLYCSNRHCAKFLGPRQTRAEPTQCGACSTQTCALCTAPAHVASARCAIDKALRKALVLGQARGWQRCPRCRQLVERSTGCYHMSCRCGAQFCYLCAAKWKTCSCTGGTSRFLRLIGARRLRVRGNYLVKSELGANGEGKLAELCKRSWRGVVNIVTRRSKVAA